VSRSTREVLLDEARDRHHLELAKYGEAHTRIGVHSAFLAVFALALVRYIDKFPQDRTSCAFPVFVGSAILLAVVTLGVFGLLLAIIWGLGTHYPPDMQTWLDHTEKLREHHHARVTQAGGEGDVDGVVARELEEDLMRSMCETADNNAAKNAMRSKLLVYAGRGLVVAALSFVVSGVSYLHLSNLGTEVATDVHITAPVQVQLQGPVQWQGPTRGNERGRKTR
jgi:hypothetical protein